MEVRGVNCVILNGGTLFTIQDFDHLRPLYFMTLSFTLTCRFIPALSGGKDMIKKGCFFLALALSFSLVMPNTSVLAGDISEPYPMPFLSFVQYHAIETSWDGDIHTRTIRLGVRNTSDRTLLDVTAVIDGSPEHVTCSDNVSSLGNIDAGATAISNDTFQISVDMSQQSGSDLRLIWRIECDMGEEHIIDETAVIENLE